MAVLWGNATVDDLRLVPGKAELVGGEIVHMSAAGGLHGYASAEIVASLRDYARRIGHGFAIGDNVGFVVNLPNRQSFSPDAAFHSGPLTADFVDGAPVFAVEIRSKGDYGLAAEASPDHRSSPDTGRQGHTKSQLHVS